ncbi:glycosyltransferase family 4 protein [Flavisphingomonas formosensis]|uniref:glycosyltransferase family 4 protein n=1 Tax=Flavisphingomonas formosensis TaxID=861534 RepID=UPI0012F81255|nr:glycosyltransferase family 4 protein [Sphingomonas formosensis]
MRIAYVINSVEGGGAAAPVPAVCAVLRAQGADVSVLALTGRDRRGLAAIEAAGLDVTVRPDGEKDHCAALHWLDARIAAQQADVIWTSLTRATLLGQIVGQRRRLPVVSWQHAAFLKPANRVLLRLRQKRSALWIADSECVAALTRQRLGVAEDRLAIWPLFAADAAAPQARAWRPGETLRIGSLGRLHPVKGYDLLIEALARLKTSGFHPATPFMLEIAGEGAERDALQGRIDAAGLRDEVRLAGFTADPRGFLASLHLYVQPSRSEGLCIGVHEAMQAGLPAIGSAVGEMGFTIQHRRTGLVVPPGDAEGFAFALAECLSAPERLHMMGVAARAHVLEKFGPDVFAGAGAAIMARLRVLTGNGTSAPHR